MAGRSDFSENFLIEMLWEKPDSGAENKSKFSALTGGLRGINGNSYFIKKSAYF